MRKKSRKGNADHIHTDHSITRCCQRGISEDMIEDTMTYGYRFPSRGIVLYSMRRKDVPARFRPDYRDRLIGLVVVVNDRGVVVTAYKDRKAHSRLNKRAA